MAKTPLVRSIGEVTPEFMTTLMRQSGALEADQAVTTVDSASFGDEAGLLSLLYRVTLTYSEGAAGPATVVVKLPTDDPNQRGTADALGLFKRECVFYETVAPTAPFQTPRVYGQAQAHDSTDFVIIMEDLGAMERIDQVVGATLAESETVLTALSKLHAQYWDHGDLDAMSATFYPIDNPVYHAALPDVFGGGWAAFKEFVPELVDSRIVEFGDNYAAHLPYMLDALNAPRTLLHGDYRSDNLLLDEDGNLAVVDFQITSIGNSAYDVAYFMSASVTTELRAEHGEHLLHIYHDALSAAGVDQSFDDLARSYRVGMAFCLIYGVASFVAWESFGDRQKDLMRVMASRSIASILDTDALATLPAL